MKVVILLLVALYVVSGCSPHVRTLDDEISEQPDRWSPSWKYGASSNNWVLLDRAVATTDSRDRIRLVSKLQGHFRHSPDRMIAERGKDHDMRMRFDFAQDCAVRLINDENGNPEVVSAGWKLQAIVLDDLEYMIKLTEKDWNEGKFDKQACREAKDAWSFASDVRRLYELYFKYSFSRFIGSYWKLPESARPAFVEQIRRCFFHRPGMKFVDRSDFPEAFK